MKSIYQTHKLDNNGGDEFIYKLTTDNFTNKDYLHNIYIKVNLPSIYSSNQRKFQWIKYLGYNIIKEISCNIKLKNKSIYFTLYSYTEWLFIWYELNLSSEEKKIHYELIGHIPELYDPANAFNRNNTYPVSHLKKQKYKWKINDNNTDTAEIHSITDDCDYNKPPSINSKILYIPINFYFCNNIKDILPFNILEYIEFKLILRPIDELYSVLLIPEDFQLDNKTVVEYINKDNFPNNVVLPSNIIFLNNYTPNFSPNAHYNNIYNVDGLSIFNVLFNEYRIKPSNHIDVLNQTDSTSINNFILDKKTIHSEVSNINQFISYQTFYESSEFCNISIVFNIIQSKIFNNPKFIYSGILSPTDIINLPSLGTDNNGNFSNSNIILPINKGNNKNIQDIFLLFRHSRRKFKNDFLNFTNLDYNNIKQWENLLNYNNIYNSHIQILNGSIWNHIKTSNSIKIGINELGHFYIKKHSFKDGLFKYDTIIEYNSDNNINNIDDRFTSDSNIKFNENIFSKFKLKLNGSSVNNNIINDTETYNFYNKISVYNKYKNTVPGLYYINNILKENDTIELDDLHGYKINIDDNKNYEYLLYCMQKKEIIL